MPLPTRVRPFGNGTRPLIQVICGGGKPKARQETEATKILVTLTTLSGVWMNRGGTDR